MYVKIPDTVMIPGAPERDRVFKVLAKLRHTATGEYRYLLSHSGQKRTMNLLNYEYMVGWEIQYVGDDFAIPKGAHIHYAYWATTRTPFTEYAGTNKDAKMFLKK